MVRATRACLGCFASTVVASLQAAAQAAAAWPVSPVGLLCVCPHRQRTACVKALKCRGLVDSKIMMKPRLKMTLHMKKDLESYVWKKRKKEKNMFCGLLRNAEGSKQKPSPGENKERKHPCKQWEDT